MTTERRPTTSVEVSAMYDLLLAEDAVLSAIAGVHGRPDPFAWVGQAPIERSHFAGLVMHVLGQQISASVALLLFGRLESAVGGRVEPACVSRLGVESIRALGLSQAKSTAVAHLADMHLSGVLDTARLEDLSDEQVITTLTAARGIGPWTAQMFLIHQLRRPDVLPAGDLGIRQAVERSWSMPALPTIDEVRSFGQRWSPHRTCAAALLWASLQPAPGADEHRPSS